MALPTNQDPNSIDNAQNIIIEEDGAPIDISPDKIPINDLDTLLGRQNGVGENYGTSVSNIAKPFQSPNFKSGVSGWRLNSNGIIEAVGVVLSGTIANTGNSETATRLATPRSIYGANFDGTAALAGPVAVGYGGTGATSLTGILKGTGTTAVTTITPLAGTKVYYVADSSGGAVTRKLTFTDGILTSET